MAEEVAKSRLHQRRDGTKGLIGEGYFGLFLDPKQWQNMDEIIEITKIPKRLNFQRIRATWVIFLKAYELWVKFQEARELWVKFQNFSHTTRRGGDRGWGKAAWPTR